MLLGVLGLVVVGEGEGGAFAAEDGAGVAGVGCYYFSWGDKHDVGRTSAVRRYLSVDGRR